jgi:hypothetical protein
MGPEAMATLRHALPHRAHLSAPRLAYCREACAHVAQALGALGYARLTVHPPTGSVIVEDAERSVDAAAVLARLRELVFAERDDQGRELRALGPEDQPGPTRIARAVAHAVAGINADVRAALDDRADLGTVLPVIFAIGGIAEVASTGKMPLPTWFNLLWWSLRSFMTFNIRAVEDEVRNGTPPTGLIAV